MQKTITTHQHIIDKKILKIYRSYFKSLEKVLLSRWHGILERCNCLTCPMFKYYGGRGIKCKFESFNEFFDYVLNELNVLTGEEIENLQIDRIDNNGHYEPGNIRFVTSQENLLNSRVYKHNRK